MSCICLCYCQVIAWLLNSDPSVKKLQKLFGQDMYCSNQQVTVYQHFDYNTRETMKSFIVHREYNFVTVEFTRILHWYVSNPGCSFKTIDDKKIL